MPDDNWYHNCDNHLLIKDVLEMKLFLTISTGLFIIRAYNNNDGVGRVLDFITFMVSLGLLIYLS